MKETCLFQLPRELYTVTYGSDFEFVSIHNIHISLKIEYKIETEIFPK